MTLDGSSRRKFDVLSILVRRIIQELEESGVPLKQAAKEIGLSGTDMSRLRRPDVYELGIRPERAIHVILKHWGVVMTEEEMADLIELVMRNPDLKDILQIMRSNRDDIKDHLIRQLKILARASEEER